MVRLQRLRAGAYARGGYTIERKARGQWWIWSTGGIAEPGEPFKHGSLSDVRRWFAWKEGLVT